MPFVDLIKRTHLVDKSAMFQRVPTRHISHWTDMPKTEIIIEDKSNRTMLDYLYINIALHVRIPNFARILQFRAYNGKICVTLDLRRTAR